MKIYYYQNEKLLLEGETDSGIEYVACDVKTKKILRDNFRRKIKTKMEFSDGFKIEIK